MLKTISWIFGFLIAIFLIAVISLFNGIEFDNVSYKNIKFSKLYLKYDKSLILSTSNLRIYNDDKSNFKDLQIELQLNDIFNIRSVYIKNLLLKEPYIRIKGYAYFDFNPFDLNLSKKTDILIKDFDLIFDKNLDNIKATECLLSLENDTLYFNFTKPKYVNFDLQESKVSIANLTTDPVLYLALYSKDMIKPELLKLLTYYNVTLPIEQLKGENNNIYTKVVIPFNNKPVEVSSKVDIHNALIKVYNKKLYVDDLNITLSNNKLLGKALLNTKDHNNSDIRYNIDISQFIDFKKEYSKGKYRINHFKYKKLSLNSSPGYFDIDFKNYFKADIYLDKEPKLFIDDKKINIKDFNTTYSKDIFTTNIIGDIDNINFSLKDKYQLNTIKSKGTLDLNSSNENIDISIEDINYTADYSNSILVKTDSKKGDIKAFEQNIYLNNIKVEYIDEVLKSSFDISDNSETYKGKLNSKIDLKNKKVQGTIFADYNYLDIFDIKNKKFTFNIAYNDGIKLLIPQLNFIYDKDIINISHLPSAIRYLEPKNISAEGNSTLRVDMTDKKTININSDNLDIVLPLELTAKKDKQKDPKSITDKRNYKFYSHNGKIKYGIFNFTYDDLNITAQNNKLDAVLKEDFTILNYVKNNNNSYIKSKYLKSEYINKLLGKNWFKNGYTSLDISNFDQEYKGMIRFNDVDVRDLTILNNIIIFINTTPALINPLLALPSLYRLSQSGFNTSKYNIQKGYLSFTYNEDKKLLNIYDIKTKSNFIDFRGSTKINLENKNIEGKIEISFFKDYASIIKKLPLINSFLLGDKGRIYTNINIYGDINDPKIKPDPIPNLNETLQNNIFNKNNSE
ncbi:MAG: AsmA-like C-terminal domain-containing protein [Campylobacterota bacterium]|nr:AsmA-like C-terminal domain-containing protein [Campylobacterota bacterium]